MTCRAVEAGHQTYVFCPEPPVPAADRAQTIARARLRDEITGDAPTSPIALGVTRPGVNARTADGGLVSLVGVPRQAFPSGAIAGTAIPWTIEAEGYVPVAVAAVLPPQPLYPDSFQPADLGVIDLHRRPIALRGRAVREVGGVRTPLAGTTITPTAARFTPDGVPVAIPANVAPLTTRVGLRRPRAVGAVARRRDLVVGAAIKRLLSPLGAGGTRARLSDRIGLAPGDLLLIDSADVERGEILTITVVEATPAPDQATWVDFDLPVSREHRDGVAVAPATLGLAGPDNVFTRAAIVGDRCLFLDGANGLPGSATIEIVGGGPTEYHAARRLLATSDANGFWRLPEISRVAALTLRGQHASASNSAVVEVSIDYRPPENRVDLVFR